jgi:ABC-type antimicrobial peptide transport system permease subunit
LKSLGLAIGIAGAIALARLITAMVYDVKPTDPAVFLAVAAVLIVVALVASLISFLRAVRIRPASALRHE